MVEIEKGARGRLYASATLQCACKVANCLSGLAKQTLPTNAFAVAQASRKRRRLSEGTMSSENKDAPEGSGSRSGYGSPVPTGLPWFAEDLDAEDLELVKRSHGDPAALGKGKAPVKGNEMLSDETLRMQVILGGNQKDSEAKRESVDPPT